MSDDHEEKEDPGQQLKQGLGLLWRAAQGAAANIKKEVDRTSIGKTLDEASRDFARAATNVVDRLASEITKKQSSPPPAPSSDEAAGGEPIEAKDGTRPEHHDDDFDGVKVPEQKSTVPTLRDPGLRIAVDDDEKKAR